MTGKRKIASVLIGLGILLLLVAVYINSSFKEVNNVFSPYTLLVSSWEKYELKFVLPEGRVIDPSQNNITTSEGQSYGMLRAVWMDDQAAFDRLWQWTKDNLKRPDDALFGWKWGQRGDASYGFLEDGGINSAADADNLIALALILASRRWREHTYLDEAKPLLADIWRLETAEANGKRYLIAGGWAQDDARLVLNPSYFVPFAWRVFAEVDSERDWISLIDPAYEILSVSGQLPLDKSRGVGLPPNWIEMNRSTGELMAPSRTELSTDYSFDAVRVPWQIALDYVWHNDQRALDYLKTAFSFLEEEYRTKQKIFGIYSHDGTALVEWDHPVIYGASLGYFMLVNEELAQQIYEEKIVKLYATEDNMFREDLGYYEQNWLWFGAALYNKQLFNYGTTNAKN